MVAINATEPPIQVRVALEHGLRLRVLQTRGRPRRVASLERFSIRVQSPMRQRLNSCLRRLEQQLEAYFQATRVSRATDRATHACTALQNRLGCRGTDALKIDQWVERVRQHEREARAARSTIDGA